jgi:hypothetical protein
MVMNVQYSTYFFHTLHTQMVRGGQGNFFSKSQLITVPQILELIPLSQIRKFFRCANPQII